MNPITVILGILAIAYGLYTLYARKNSPEQFTKLEAMEEQWGSAGRTLHVLSYSVVPIIVGVVLLLSGLSAE